MNKTYVKPIAPVHRRSKDQLRKPEESNNYIVKNYDVNSNNYKKKPQTPIK